MRHAPGRVGKGLVARQLIRSYRRSPVQRLARTDLGPEFLVHTSDTVQIYLYLFGVWEPNITHWMREVLRPGDAVVDVGTNIGYYAVLASATTDGGRVVAIEASPDFAARARRNVELNSCEDVRLLNVAVSDRRAELAFHLPNPQNGGSTSAVPADGPPVFTAGGVPLADVLQDDELRRARIVKIDVEGLEYAVVKGLEPVLGELRDDAEFVVEVDPPVMAAHVRRAAADPEGTRAVAAGTAADLVELFARWGFHPYRIANLYTVGHYVRFRPSRPERCRDPLTQFGDYVFSRIDRDHL